MNLNFFPDIFISTKEAYSNIEPKNPEANLLDVISSPLQEWKEKLKNDFESYVFQNILNCKRLKMNLQKRCCLFFNDWLRKCYMQFLKIIYQNLFIHCNEEFIIIFCFL